MSDDEIPMQCEECIHFVYEYETNASYCKKDLDYPEPCGQYESAEGWEE
jgi:hypothetical protein